jgi:hypothetical protein
VVEIPWDEIPAGGARDVVPSGFYLLEVESLDETASKAGGLMYVGRYKAVEGPHAGAVLTEYHNIGTQKDPQAKDPQTWREAIGAKTLRALVEACGLPLQRDPAMIMKTVRGQRFVQQVLQYEEPKTRKEAGVEVENRFAGMPANKLQRKFRVGERVADNGAAGPAPVATAAKPAAAGPGMVKSPYGDEMIPISELQEHIRKHTQKSS